MKTYNDKLRNYNWENYISNLKKITDFDEKLSYPSLLSKSLLSGDQLFWEKFYKVNFNNLIKNLIKTLIFIFPRLIFSYIGIYILNKFSNIKERKIAFIFSRAAGIKNLNSLEDYRFKGLESNLIKKNIITVYFVYDNKKIKSKFNTIYIRYRDIYFFAESIYNLKLIFSKNKVKYWRYILKINIYQAKILSLFTKYTNYCFFWDFNYQHYPFFLAGHLKNNTLIGSMHAYHNKDHMPWIDSKIINHLDIKHYFCDYIECANLIKSTKNQKTISSKSNLFKSKENSLIKSIDLVIIQENQLSQKAMLEWVARNKKFFKKIFVKIRPDRADSEEFLKTLKEMEIFWDDYININKVKNLFFIGQASTYILDLCLEGNRTLIFNPLKLNWFENPSRGFDKNIHLIKKEKLKKIIYPIYINPKLNFKENYIDNININKNLKISTLNHYIFKKNKLKVLSSFFK